MEPELAVVPGRIAVTTAKTALVTTAEAAAVASAPLTASLSALGDYSTTERYCTAYTDHSGQEHSDTRPALWASLPAI